MKRVLLLVLALALFTPEAVIAQEWPEAAQKRYQDAIALTSGQHPQHAEAAKVFREVADWPEGGPAVRERAKALYMAAHELTLAGDLENALATYAEVQARFPDDAFAQVARRDVLQLAPPGVPNALEFRRRHDAALDELVPALALADARERETARPHLEKALTLLDALRRDYPEHPQAVDVLRSISDVLVRLNRLEEAQAIAETAVALAKERAAVANPSPTAAGDVVSAQGQLDEARRAIRLRRVGVGAKVVLAALAFFFICLRPWRRANRRVAWLGVLLLALDVVFAGLGALGADYVRRFQAPGSAIDPLDGAVLVFFPGLIGAFYAVGFTLTLRRRSGVVAAALLGATGALAAVTCLIQQYGFFDFLPDL